MEYLIALLLGVVGSLIAAEICANSKRWSKRIIEAAVARLPEPVREARREEWLAHLEDCPSAYSQLRHAVGCYSGAGSMVTVPSVARAGVWSRISGGFKVFSSLRRFRTSLGWLVEVGAVLFVLSASAKLLGTKPELIDKLYSFFKTLY